MLQQHKEEAFFSIISGLEVPPRIIHHGSQKGSWCVFPAHKPKRQPLLRSRLSAHRKGPGVRRSHSAPSDGEIRPCKKHQAPEWACGNCWTRSLLASDVTGPIARTLPPNFFETKGIHSLWQLPLPGFPIKPAAH